MPLPLPTQALLAGGVDLLVNCVKDMETVQPPELCLTAICERADASDCFVSNSAPSLQELPAGAVVGTSSLRRTAMVRRARPDLIVKTVRGNVQRRLAKLDARDTASGEGGEYDALVMAR